MLDHPAVIAVAIPMVISILFAALSRAMERQPAAIHVLSIGGLAGFLVAYVMLMGWPEAMPPIANRGATFWCGSIRPGCRGVPMH